jgi:CheY-like chemotaxis protein
LKRILVVDDEAQIRSMLTQMLEQEGYEVYTAENGEEGFTLVGRHSFDLVITDMIMPVKDGLKFIMELVRDYPDLKILAISGGGRHQSGALPDYGRLSGRYCHAGKTV